MSRTIESAELDGPAARLRDYFVGWQCRLRQQAVRKMDGRPSEGMLASLSVSISDRQLGPINVLLVRRDPDVWTDEFRFLVKKTHDPNNRFKAALKILGSSYYQHPREFDDRLVASFAVDSELAQVLIEQAECRLDFEQYQQRFTIFCKVENLPEADPAHQAVYWHNSLFNSTMPGHIKVLGFQPDWSNSIADPAAR